MFSKRNTHLLVLVCLVAVGFAHVGYSHASVTVRALKTFTNPGVKADDFHVKVWQKEDNIDIQEFNVDFQPGEGGTSVSSESAAMGDQPEPAHSNAQNHPDYPPTTNADNGMHAVDAEMTGNIPHGAKLKVRVRFVLTNENTIRFHNPVWTFDSEGAGVTEADAGPNDGFVVTNPIDQGDGTWKHIFRLFNDDNNGTTDRTIVKNLRFGTVDDFSEIDDPDALEAFSDFGTPEDDFLLLSGAESVPFPIVTTGPLVGGGIVAAYELVDAGTEQELASAVIGHEVPGEAGGEPVCGDEVCEAGEDCENCPEDCPPECDENADCDDDDACTTDSCADGCCDNEPIECPEGEVCVDGVCTSVPTVSEWGLIIMMLLALTAGTIVFARRRRRAAA